MKTTILAVLVATAATVALAYDSLEDLQKDFAAKQSKALQEYIADHPDAEDIADARQTLQYSLYMAGKTEDLLALVLQDYEKLAVSPSEVELQELGQVVSGIVKLQQQLGKKDEAAAFVKRVGVDFGKREDAEELKGLLENLTAMLGQPAVGESMDVKFTATDGTKVDLAAMKGKVVLVDFWATWCGPCVRELPNVKETYTKHHDGGFEIIGVSLDDDKDKLAKFVKDKEIPWPQFFDGNGWQNELAKRYGIQSIPATFLIGADGLIAAVDLRGAALEKKVTELLADSATN